MRHAVITFFSMQRGDQLTVAGDVNIGFAAGIVRTLNVAHITENKVVIMDIHAIAGFHAYVTLDAVILAEGDTNHRHRYAKMAEHYAPVATRQMRQTAPEGMAVGSAFVQLHQRQYNHPH